jgi:hypothetical protein
MKRNKACSAAAIFRAVSRKPEPDEGLFSRSGKVHTNTDGFAF